MRVYADHAATTKLDIQAYEAMEPYLLGEYGNASQLYSFSRKPKKALKEAREMIASCINASPEEIYFTSGGTESDNWAIKGATFLNNNRLGIITSSIEHHAVLNSCNTCKMMGVPVTYLPVNTHGEVLVEPFKQSLTEGTGPGLVSVMLANNEIGSIQPIRELTEITHEKGILFHTDAVQAVGHIPINVSELDVDLLSASAHKFNGPKGVGFLYIRKGIDIATYSDGGNQEAGLRAGTENVAGIVGMAKALEVACKKMKQRTEILTLLERHLIKRLNQSQLKYIRNGSANHLPGNISLSFRDADGEMLLHRLDLMGICVSTGSACNSNSKELSHVIKAINVPEDYAYGTIRISLGQENTIEEIEYIIEALKRIIR